jgi:hypothetical protein
MNVLQLFVWNTCVILSEPRMRASLDKCAVCCLLSAREQAAMPH